MKKIIFLFFTCLLFVSCENNDLVNANQSSSTSCSTTSGIDNLINFNSSKDLENVINTNGDLTRSVVSRFRIGKNFISLMDAVTPSYEHWDDFSKDEQDTILADHLTYYEALGYEDLVPNENFAKLLNYKGEVIVDDSLYRITPLGTLCSDTLNYKDLDQCYNQLLESNDSITFNNNTQVSEVKRIDLFNK